ncbi:MAG: CRTAC1 family protein [Planctomycetes bacterium]|nr:CRTAC1 family protein [Planctomycetota bacterium]
MPFPRTSIGPRAWSLAMLLGAGCSPESERAATSSGGASGGARAISQGAFADESRSRGVLHLTARGGDDYFMPDSMGPGCAVFDADGDGREDLFFVEAVRDQNGALESEAGRDRLLFQQADGSFHPAAKGFGADDPRYGMGAAVADVEGDGDLDLFVTNYGSSRLFKNQGRGTFEDATEASGIREEGWAATAGFCDYDADGRPDLFVTRYLELDPSVRGKGAGGAQDYPSPLQFSGLADRLWHNEGDGRFRDVSHEAGLATRVGRGLGLAFLDLDGDARLDIFVANDSEPNFAWVQTAPGRFENRAFALGLAVNRVGRAQANMGVAVGDVGGEGDFELFVTHLVAEANVLHQRGPGGTYADVADRAGLSTASLDLTGFGTQFGDVENDGDQDLLVLNGRILRRGPRAAVDLPLHWVPYAEECQLFLNDGSGRFRLAGAEEGGDFSRAIAVGRALVVADLDRDGGLDLVVANGDGSSRLYRNRLEDRGHFLSVRARGADGKSDALGAVIEVRAGGRTWVRILGTCQGYLSAGPPAAHFGLGEHSAVDGIVVHWPGGIRESFDASPADQERVLVRGTGKR